MIWMGQGILLRPVKPPAVLCNGCFFAHFSVTPFELKPIPRLRNPTLLPNQQRGEHEEKSARIQEVKLEKEATKARLEKRKAEVPEGRMRDSGLLQDKYDKLREEYNALLLPK
ncbi:hypothetical protein MLD38_004187 [Melastoma candidum]|uniref:Uncharacterized protein n=1 Tax=Melastoma candidum TaxID=119954 RepID=A0ACB9S5Q5_9MYRT|nr:hypothetical protein MLD38_004187 [Melastoma candidum]